MTTIIAARIFKTCSSLVTIINSSKVLHLSYRNVHQSKPFLIRPKLDSSCSTMEDGKQKNKVVTMTTGKQVWRVLDEWPPKNTSPPPSPSKRKMSSKGPKSKEEKLESMRRFLLQNDADFQKDIAPKTVKEKDEKNKTRKVTSKPALDHKEKKSSSQKKNEKDSIEPKPSGSKKLKYSSSSTGSNVEEFQFSVLSYNILADNLLLAHPKLYRECKKEMGVLDWNNRWEGIKREIVSSQSPDIICLQEVQFQNPDHAKTHIIPFLSSMGYRSIVKPKTGQKDDGCLIAFSRDRFLLEDTIPVDYKVDRVSVLDRDNVGLILKLVPLSTVDGLTRQHSPILVANTHLLYNPKRTDIRLCQSALLLAELDRLALHHRSQLPIILTGDFNSEPWSPVLGLFLNKRHHYAGSQLGRGGRVAPDKLLPDSLGLSDTCQWLVSLQQRGAHQDFITGSGAFSHNINFRSVFPPGGPVTTHQEGWTMVDYILYASQSDKLQLRGKKDLPSVEEMMAHGRIPSQQFPSDHLSLLAKFSLKLQN